MSQNLGDSTKIMNIYDLEPHCGGKILCGCPEHISVVYGQRNRMYLCNLEVFGPWYLIVIYKVQIFHFIYF